MPFLAWSPSWPQGVSASWILVSLAALLVLGLGFWLGWTRTRRSGDGTYLASHLASSFLSAAIFVACTSEHLEGRPLIVARATAAALLVLSGGFYFLRRVFAGRPRPGDAPADHVRVLQNAGFPHEAIALGQVALKESPGEVRVKYQLARAFKMLGAHDEARRLCTGIDLAQLTSDEGRDLNNAWLDWVAACNSSGCAWQGCTGLLLCFLLPALGVYIASFDDSPGRLGFVALLLGVTAVLFAMGAAAGADWMRLQVLPGPRRATAVQASVRQLIDDGRPGLAIAVAEARLARRPDDAQVKDLLAQAKAAPPAHP